MESMNEGNNILDELNCEKNKFSQQKMGLKEMIKNITLQLDSQKISQLNNV